VPKFSIITVCKNTEQVIERTICSVVAQNFQNYEYIIIDGNSTDKTKQILEKYNEHITKIISESDTGIYDAMNKGINLATGEYLFFLNAGDVFLHDAVLTIAASLVEKKPVDIVYGQVFVLNQKTGKGYIKETSPYLNKWMLFRNTVPHQAAFISKKIFEQVGLYDANLRICGDYDWFLKALLRCHCNYVYHEFVCSIYCRDGISSSENVLIEHENERKCVQRKYAGWIGLLFYNNYFIYETLFFLNKFWWKLCKKFA
jgi:glycosyltransferase involved in cell wall biosynthesis